MELLIASGAPPPSALGGHQNSLRESGHQRWGDHHSSSAKQLGFVGLVVGLAGTMRPRGLTGLAERVGLWRRMGLVGFLEQVGPLGHRGLVGLFGIIRFVGFVNSAELRCLTGLRLLVAVLQAWLLRLPRLLGLLTLVRLEDVEESEYQGLPAGFVVSSYICRVTPVGQRVRARKLLVLHRRSISHRAALTVWAPFASARLQAEGATRARPALPRPEPPSPAHPRSPVTKGTRRAARAPTAGRGRRWVRGARRSPEQQFLGSRCSSEFSACRDPGDQPVSFRSSYSTAQLTKSPLGFRGSLTQAAIDLCPLIMLGGDAATDSILRSSTLKLICISF